MGTVNHGHGFGSFLGTFVVGAAAGATIALLTAPRSGRETRVRLKASAREMGESLQKFPVAVQKFGAEAARVSRAAFAQAKEEITLAYNKAAGVGSRSVGYVGYALDKELPRFAR
jgi:gas vesicle protein